MNISQVKLTLLQLARGLILLGAMLCLNACETRLTKLPAVLGRPLYAVDMNNNLVRFGSLSSRTITNTNFINGLRDGETILAIDFRPADRQLYGLGSSNRLYVIDTLSGAALQRGISAFSPSLSGASFGFDVNPVPDRLRLHSNAEQDLRFDPDTGVTAGRDSALAYANGDIYAGINPNIVGTAYTNSVRGATSTTLYAIDSFWDVLVTLPTPNNGQMLTVGALGVNTADFVGFDIAGRDGAAYAVLTVKPNGGSSLYQINLSSGVATYLDDIGRNLILLGLAIMQ